MLLGAKGVNGDKWQQMIYIKSENKLRCWLFLGPDESFKVAGTHAIDRLHTSHCILLPAFIFKAFFVYNS